MAPKTATEKQTSEYAATRQRLEDFVCTACGIKTKKDSKKAVDAVFDGLQQIFADNMKNEGFSFRTPLGTFKVQMTGAKKGRNPQTGEKVDIAPKHKLSLKVMKSLQELGR